MARSGVSGAGTCERFSPLSGFLFHFFRPDRCAPPSPAKNHIFPDAPLVYLILATNPPLSAVRPPSVDNESFASSIEPMAISANKNKNYQFILRWIFRHFKTNGFLIYRFEEVGRRLYQS